MPKGGIQGKYIGLPLGRHLVQNHWGARLTNILYRDSRRYSKCDQGLECGAR